MAFVSREIFPGKVGAKVGEDMHKLASHVVDSVARFIISLVIGTVGTCWDLGNDVTLW